MSIHLGRNPIGITYRPQLYWSSKNATKYFATMICNRTLAGNGFDETDADIYDGPTH